jgi:hypothetical protein
MTTSCQYEATPGSIICPRRRSAVGVRASASISPRWPIGLPSRDPMRAPVMPTSPRSPP